MVTWYDLQKYYLNSIRYKDKKGDILSEPALKAGLWVSALIRTCDINSIPAVVRRRGDPDAGSIVLRLDRLNGRSEVLTQIRDAEGRRCWLRVLGNGPAADMDVEEYLKRRVRSDPDIWIVEIEDRDARYDPDAPVVS